MSLSRTGLPTGLQLIAAPGRDDRLLAIAAAVEAALPWRRAYR
jgi:amidase